ncbi:MAG TPA: 3D domain-containing protein [Symbiobacteriaceae bacterium]|jgi:3D (Asp-Asp-Asp) domain-containing protein
MRLAALLVSAMLMSGPAGDAPAAEAVPAFDRPGAPTQWEMTATAYTSGPESTGKRRGHPLYGLTATGTRARQGRTIAVDPARIPLGSRVCVAELGECLIAEDTGGAIRGNRVDLYMENVADALRWGRQRVRIQVFPKI